MSWFRRTPEGFLLAIHAQPGAKRNELAGLHGERLKVRVASPAVDGRANDALIRFLAERLGVPRARLRIARGARSRDKVVEVLAPEKRDAEVAALAQK